ncbi:MAG: hypothetical protein ACOYKN_06750 [Pirellula sp.]
MSRYAFIAAATLFTGLLVVLTMAIAQRDSRVTSTIPDVDAPGISAVLAKPILVDSQAIGPDGGVVPSLPPNRGIPKNPLPENPLADTPLAGIPSADRADSYESKPIPSLDSLQPDPFGTWAGDPPSVIALASGQSPAVPVAEPPKFDASRIVAPRPRTENPPTLLPPGGSPVAAPPAIALPTLPEVPSLGPSLGVPTQPPVAAPRSAPVFPPVMPDPVPSSPGPASPGPASPGPASPGPQLQAPISAPGLPAFPSQPPALGNLPTEVPLSEVSQPRSLSPRSQGPAPTSMPAALPTSRSLSDPADPPSLTSRGAPGWSMATATPGSRQFDGSQNPSLEIHKRAPSEVQVGVASSFTAVVRNVGNSTAFDVQVTDAIPKGARLVRTFPEAQRVGNDGLAWNLGELAAGQEATITMEIVPESEGEIGSVASVKFAAQASVRTISTQPRLSVKQTAVAEMLGGDSATIFIDLSNTGTGVARDVRLEEDVPSVFRHVTGASALQQDVGDLAPGETLRFEIELMALSAGKVSNMVRATSSNCATAESSYPIEVKAPKLQLQFVGPKLRHLERPAPYEAVIENVGTAVARDLYITARLPRGMNFISASNEGTYLPDQHSVVWNLMELGAGAKAKTDLVLLPVEEGRFSISMTTDAEGVRAEPTQRDVVVEGQSELTFEIDDDNDPIEVAGMTTYTVRINNIGTRPDAEVRLVVEAPEGATIEQVNSPMKYQVSGRQVVFAAIPSLASKQQVTVKVGVKHSKEGTQVLRASLQSQLRAVPVVKDESTQVYRDR